MKSLIKKIAVFVFALVVMTSTASTVLAKNGGGSGSNHGTGWNPPAPWSGH